LYEEIEVMRKIVIAAISVVFLSGMGYAGDFYVQAKGMYFNPTDDAFKEIYGSGFMYGGEIGFGIGKGVELWVDGMYFGKTGETTLTREETKLTLFPLSGGVKAKFDFGVFNLYVGGGVSYFQYKETSSIGEVRENKWGWMIRAGTYIDITYFFFLDLQATYNYTKFTTEDLEVNLGGFSFGAGLGFRF
jgi:hypothetical protein